MDSAADDIELLRKELRDDENVLDESENDDHYHGGFSISSYGADYTVDSLVKRLNDEAFYVPPFQRLYVWNVRQASRFIESLLMGLPVPGIFVFRESGSTGRHLIVDGQQRLKTMQFFYQGIFLNKPFRLSDVRRPWDGKRYIDLDTSDRLRLDDSIIHTTVFRQDQPAEDDQSIYEVFERLNTGGSKLSDQEVRVCVNFGPMTNLLDEMNKTSIWRNIYGPESVRQKDEELILRFLALLFDRARYKRPMRAFLNSFLQQNKNISEKMMNEYRNIFDITIKKINSSLGDKPFRPQRSLNAAVFDAVMVAVAELMSQGEEVSDAVLRRRYDQLLKNDDFQRAFTRSTADEEQLARRLRLAQSVLMGRDQ